MQLFLFFFFILPFPKINTSLLQGGAKYFCLSNYVLNIPEVYDFKLARGFPVQWKLTLYFQTLVVDWSHEHIGSRLCNTVFIPSFDHAMNECSHHTSSRNHSGITNSNSFSKKVGMNAQSSRNHPAMAHGFLGVNTHRAFIAGWIGILYNKISLSCYININTHTHTSACITPWNMY